MTAAKAGPTPGPEQAAALEWLEEWARSRSTEARHARTIKAMLAEPRLPEEPTADMLDAMRLELKCRMTERPDLVIGAHLHHVYRALREHLSTPPTPPMRSVNVWNVEYLWSTDAGKTWQPAIELYTSEEAARRFAREPRHGAVVYRDVSVTGPHERRVPV